MSQVNTQYEPAPVESSARLLGGVRMSHDARELAIIHMRRAEALVDLGFRAAAHGKRALRRVKGGLRAVAQAVKVALQVGAHAAGGALRGDSDPRARSAGHRP